MKLPLSAQALAQQRILVTRPAHQAQPLCALIRACGGIPWVFPVLDIQPVADDSALERCRNRLEQYALAIFISANAVHYALPKLLENGALPAQLQLAAVGKGTAAAMQALGCAPHWLPAQFNSEGLLALPELQQMQGKRVLILRGEGGRELLAETLRERGAQLDTVAVYRRCVPVLDKNAHPWLVQGEIDSIVISSGEGLQNLLQLLGNPPWLQDKSWALISPRLLDKLRQAGVQGAAAIAPQSDDEGLLQALLHLHDKVSKRRAAP